MAETLPGLLLEKTKKYGDRRTALREKEFGIWQTISWAEYYEHVRYFALGLKALGFNEHDTLAIIGDNRPEWVYAELATQGIKGIPLGIYQDALASDIVYILNHSEAKVVVAEDQEQVDKILEAEKLNAKPFPNLKWIVYTDAKGMRDYKDPRLIFFPQVEVAGRTYKDQDFFEKSLKRLSKEDYAIIAYTSGTTGFPKGALLTHRAMLSMSINLDKVDPKKEADEFVSFLPLPWMGEQMMAVSSALYIGFTVNFPEEPETAFHDIYEIGPQVIFSPPRVWETLSRRVMVKHLDATPFKRLIFKLCMPIGYKWADFKFNKQTPSFYWKVMYGLAYILLFRALRDRMGFSHLRYAYTGGAALGPDVFRFFHALGVNLKQIYGQTEIAGISCVHRDEDIDFNTVGKPIPETEIKIYKPDKEGIGEIISRSPALFSGYYKNEEATKETLRDGWLFSGDAGYIDKKGHLVCIDRIKDIQVLKDGTRFSPMFIENKLKFCPYIVEAMVIGHKRDYITAIICIDYQHTGKWAEDRHISYTTYTDLASKSEVYDLIAKEVMRVNKDLPASMQIKKFLLLYKEFDPDDGELTRTRKLRRRFIAEKYRREIEALYQDITELPVESEIKFQDGRVGKIKTVLKIKEVRPASLREEKTKKWWQFWR